MTILKNHLTNALLLILMSLSLVACTPTATKPGDSVESIAGTMWSGIDSDGDYYEYYFKAGGTMHYRSPHGLFKTRANWEQNGNKVILWTGNKYAKRTGTITGSRMSGNARNNDNRTWNWNATKQSARWAENVPSVAGTVWTGTDSDGDYYEYHLKADGVMHYRSPAGFFTRNASWQQKGSELTMWTGNKYATRRGIIMGNKIAGNAWNKRNRKWKWTATKKAGGSSSSQLKPSNDSSLAGSMWSGIDSDGDYYEYYFKARGVLHYRSPHGLFKTRASWEHKGNQVILWTGNKYAKRTGLIRGNKMAGSARNNDNRTWDWNATRQSARWAENVPSVVGTVWAGTDTDGDYYEYHLKADGVLHYRSPTGFFTRDASWQQKGSELTMWTGNRYATRRGLIMGNKIAGNAWNDNNRKWAWTATLKKRNGNSVSLNSRTASTGLDGTMWSGIDTDGDYYEYYLKPDGVLHYRSPQGMFTTRASWEKKGNRIVMWTGNKYAKRSGVIRGNRMKGSARNNDNRTWDWTAVKQSARWKEKVRSIAGSVWAGTDSDGDYYEYHLKRGGVMHYRSPAGFFKRNARWQQKGSEITMWTGKKYATRRGIIQGNRMAGNAWNKGNRKWTWQATRLNKKPNGGIPVPERLPGKSLEREI